MQRDRSPAREVEMVSVLTVQHVRTLSSEEGALMVTGITRCPIK